MNLLPSLSQLSGWYCIGLVFVCLLVIFGAAHVLLDAACRPAPKLFKKPSWPTPTRWPLFREPLPSNVESIEEYRRRRSESMACAPEQLRARVRKAI